MTARELHFFPDYSAGNPFQTMLHAGLGLVAARAVPVTKLIPYLTHAAGQPDPGVLALHWTGPVLTAADGPFRARLLLDRFIDSVTAFTDAGGRLVWTVHNVLPHEVRHRWAELELARFLADRAGLVDLLSPATFTEVGGLYDLDPAKVVVIEHSGYQGYYRDEVTRDVARERLGLAPGDQALLALGAIRPYKGLDVLLDVLEADPRPDLRLLVAGRPGADPQVDALRERCDRNPRVISLFEHVPDDEVQLWARAADVAVLPYRDVLNSGAFLLAQTFGLPVVGPRVGALRAWEDQLQVRLFEPGVAVSLAAAIDEALEAVRADPAGLRDHALRAAESRPPEAMASAYAAAVAPLLSGGAGPTALP